MDNKVLMKFIEDAETEFQTFEEPHKEKRFKSKKISKDLKKIEKIQTEFQNARAFQLRKKLQKIQKLSKLKQMSSLGKQHTLASVIKEFNWDQAENPVLIYLKNILQPGGKLKPKKKPAKKVQAQN